MALRIRVNISAIGSVMKQLRLNSCYQLDLTTPGICPWSANSRKQMRHRLNFTSNLAAAHSVCNECKPGPKLRFACSFSNQ